jgi:prevent-host-death family protein
VSEVTIRDLRNKGGEVIDRVAGGEVLTITRDGRQVAELRPLPRAAESAAVLVERWTMLPRVDPDRLRRDLARVIDERL